MVIQETKNSPLVFFKKKSHEADLYIYPE